MEAPEYFHTVSYHHQQHQNQMMMISPEKKYCSEVKNGGGGGGGDFFPIEDLLDFSNEEFYGGGGGVENGGGSGGNSTDSSTITAVGETAGSSSNSSFSGEGGRSGSSLVDPNFPEDLCVPYEDLAELEWLSNFVDEDDSFSSEDFQKLQIISGVKARDDHHPSANGTPDYKFENNSGNDALTARCGANSSFKTESPVPARARSKRSRAAACNWSSRLIVLSPTSSSSECEVFVEGGEKQAPLSPSPVKLGKKRELSEHPEGRKCLHCATDKTPQWRTGPLGPKTLCNACGVRYKSGRLVPEYRPAASPTFVLTKHSNSHRKVLELRRQKDLHTAQRQFFQQAGVFDVSAGNDNADDYLIHTGPDYRQLI